MAVLLSALSELKPAKKPFLTVISTTGISQGPRDVPILFAPLYYWMLHVPHIDKRLMEQLLRDEAQKSGNEPAFESYVVVRASLLTDGERQGLSSIRVGTEAEPAVGYTVSRNDVGPWVYEELLKIGIPAKWKNSFVTVTY